MNNINIVELDKSFPYEYINIENTEATTLNPIIGLNAKQIFDLLEEGSMVELDNSQKELAINALSLQDEGELYLFDCIDALSKIDKLSYFSQRVRTAFLPVGVSYLV